MQAGLLLLILSDIISMLYNIGIISADGVMRAPTAAEDSIIGARTELILKNRGITVPNKVDTVLEILPLALSLAGIK